MRQQTGFHPKNDLGLFVDDIASLRCLREQARATKIIITSGFLLNAVLFDELLVTLAPFQ